MSKWAPSRKWWAQATAGLASIAASWIVTGVFDDVERGMAATLLVAVTSSYWVPNRKVPSRRAVKAKVAHVESRDRRS